MENIRLENVTVVDGMVRFNTDSNVAQYLILALTSYRLRTVDRTGTDIRKIFSIAPVLIGGDKSGKVQVTLSDVDKKQLKLALDLYNQFGFLELFKDTSYTSQQKTEKFIETEKTFWLKQNLH